MQCGRNYSGLSFGNNWFLGRSIQQPNMFNPESVVVVRKGYAGECLSNYRWVSFLAKNMTPCIRPWSPRLMESFHPGELDTVPH